MKNFARALLIITTIALTSMAASAQTSKFLGKYKNVAGGITTLEITGTGAALKVHAWGQCSPTDCDWGTVPGFAYSDNVGSNPTTDALSVSAVFTTGFNSTTLIITPLTNKQLLVTSYTRFTDSSGRVPYTSTYILKKV
jgi:hypothetical protein